MDNTPTQRVAYFLSHPIQYQSPLLREMAVDQLAMTTVYGRVDTAERHFDSDYGQEVSWELPLLEGYAWDVLRQPSLPALFWGWKREAGRWLDLHKPDAVWVHGWGTAFSIGCLLAAHERQLPLMVRGETHLKSRRGSALWQILHRAVLSRVFSTFDKLLAIGTANRELYRYYRVPEEKIGFVPYVVDNLFFQSSSERGEGQLDRLREDLGLDAQRSVLLYVGRLSPEKDLITLLKALQILAKDQPVERRPYLLIAGTGPQQKALQKYASEWVGEQVRFLGFVPPVKLPALYKLCDVFVLPSRFEPWGMVVNEAMNAGRPIVVSDRVGSGVDLVRQGQNGFRFRAGDERHLAEALLPLLSDSAFRQRAGALSLQRIQEWGLQLASAGAKSAIDELPHASGVAAASCHSRSQGIRLAYIGVHEIFQLALAAEEMDELKSLRCSLFNAPGMWGRLALRLASVPLASPVGGEALPASKISEYPWPMLMRQTLRRAAPWIRSDPLVAHGWFERSAARQLSVGEASIVVGSETCAFHWFQAAKRLGMKCLLDCHGIPAPFLDRSIQRASEEFGFAPPPPSDSEGMAWHKQQERHLADVLLFCSELQRDIWVSLGEPLGKSRAVPLWVDSSFWHPIMEDQPYKGPLRVLVVGAGTIAKGLPYLLKACDTVGSAIELTLVGNVVPQLHSMLGRCKSPIKMLPYMARAGLRSLYGRHDLVVMPSLGDSFGFVAMEAMACGLPVVVTSHCGAPVPFADWRVPAHSSEDLAARLLHYAERREQIAQDSSIARDFALQFSPAEYRRKVSVIYRELLSPS